MIKNDLKMIKINPFLNNDLPKKEISRKS